MSETESPDKPVVAVNAVIEVYKRDVDRTLIRENLKLSVSERMDRFEQIMRGFLALREAGQKVRSDRGSNKKPVNQ